MVVVVSMVGGSLEMDDAMLRARCAIASVDCRMVGATISVRICCPPPMSSENDTSLMFSIITADPITREGRSPTPPPVFDKNASL